MLFGLALSESLWEQRIAVVSQLYFVKFGRFDEMIEIARLLLDHKHDLIHKAVGWLLREIGKQDLPVLEAFLQDQENYMNMPRTMLRYAISKFDEQRRKEYLHGQV